MNRAVVLAFVSCCAGCGGTSEEEAGESYRESAAASAPCTLDTRTFTLDGKGHRVESITARGRYWNFDVSAGLAPWPDNGSDLTSVARFVTGGGPCAGRAPGSCVFQTRSFTTGAGGHRIESITAYGRYWNFDMDAGGKALPGSGSSLATVPRYSAAGPCAGRSSCAFDTRTFTVGAAGRQLESITAYGRYWNFDMDAGGKPLPDNGTSLTAVARFAASGGPCAGKSTCKLDTRTFTVGAGGHRLESITAYDRYWNFDIDAGGQPLSDNGSYLTRWTRYDGSCGIQTSPALTTTRLLSARSDLPQLFSFVVGLSATSHGTKIGWLDGDTNALAGQSTAAAAGPLAVSVGNIRLYQSQTISVQTDGGPAQIYLPRMRPAAWMALYVGKDGTTYYADDRHDGSGRRMDVAEAITVAHRAQGPFSCGGGDGCRAGCPGGDPDCTCFQQGGEMCLEPSCSGGALAHREPHVCCAQRCNTAPVLTLRMAFAIIDFTDYGRRISQAEIDQLEQVRRDAPEIVRRATYGKIAVVADRPVVVVRDVPYVKYKHDVDYLLERGIDLAGVDLMNFYQAEWDDHCGTTAHYAFPRGLFPGAKDLIGYSSLCDTHRLDKYGGSTQDALNLHELGHQWSFYLCPQKTIGGVEVRTCGKSGHIFSAQLESYYDPMGGSTFVPHGGVYERFAEGGWTSRKSTRFSDLSLFQMGVMSRHQVGPVHYYHDSVDPVWIDPASRVRFRQRLTLSVDDIVCFADASVGRDSDNDRIPDWLERQGENGYRTDEYNPDTDGDGMSDGDELAAGRNPLAP